MDNRGKVIDVQTHDIPRYVQDAINQSFLKRDREIEAKRYQEYVRLHAEAFSKPVGNLSGFVGAFLGILAAVGLWLIAFFFCAMGVLIYRFMASVP